MEENFESTNIHLDWLNNIYKQLMRIQEFEKISREGCSSLIEYLQIPFEYQGIMIPDAMYKNMRFFALELDILIDNIIPDLNKEDGNNKSDDYYKRLKPVLDNIDKRHLFIRERRINNQIIQLILLPFFYTTINHLMEIKSNIIKDIGHILYINNEDKKKTW